MTQVQSAVHVTKRLIWLELTHSTIFFRQRRLWHRSLEVTTWYANWVFSGSLPILRFFRKLVAWLYVPSEWTYNLVSIFLCSRTKKTFKLPSRATFAIAKFLYLFTIPQLTLKFQYLSRICQMMTCTISGTCHHEVNYPRVNSFNNISFGKSTLTP